ncbi:MAG TPA: helix-turn-helix domain-containing protein [Anaerolineales bacterium]|jgi:DNA-binding HxlR family transcriptional regulator|nr:helix-turn-helix domain-containing protein [Anaerolineales bacterium]
MGNDDPHCGYEVEATARLLSGKWTLLILYYLAEGRQRFGELEKLLGVNPRTLSNRLSDLEMAGAVHREGYAEVPPRVEYSLTEKGRGLIPIIEAMSAYAERWMKVGEDTS